MERGLRLDDAMSAWIENVMQQFGAWGVALLMLLANVFPPIPSMVVIPWAGYATFLTFIGWWLGSNYASLSEPLGWISTAVVIILVGLWLNAPLESRNLARTFR